MLEQPLVTIVTPCYNSADTLARTIESVLAQTYPHIEYIIMDGASTDATRAVVQPYLTDPRLTFISEPDSGQSNAINKGWSRANGQVLAWLCADDTYFPYSVQSAIDALTADPAIGWVYGYDRYVNRHGEPIPFRQHFAEWDYEQYLTQALYISQPTVFWRREVIEQCGNIREDLHTMMDMEFFLRIGKRYPAKLIPQTLATVTWTRETKTFSGGKARLQEMIAVMHQYGGGEIAPNVRTQWADTSLQDLFAHLRRAEWGKARAAFNDALHYPAHLPRGFAKLLVRSLLNEQLETRLRQVLLKQQPTP